MKLQIENNSSSEFMGSRDLSSDVSSANGSAEVTEMLRRGIKAAQEGSRAEARHLLMQATEIEPKNENAWLWLASISEYPEELLIFLSNVLSVNPENERALEWEKSTKSLLSKTFVQRGIEASKESQTAFAKQCFLQAIVHDDKNEMAWLWLASISQVVEEKKSHIQKALNINPNNETALALLKSVKTEMAAALLRKAQVAALSGERDDAAKMLGDCFKHAPDLEDAWMLKSFLSDSFSEKMNFFERVLEINPENEDAASCLAAMRLVSEKTEPKPDSVAVKDFNVAEIVSGAQAELQESEDVSGESEADSGAQAEAAAQMPEETLYKAEFEEYTPVEEYPTAEETADYPTQDFSAPEEPAPAEAEAEFEVEFKAEVEETADDSPRQQDESFEETAEMTAEVYHQSQDEESEMHFAFSEVEETGENAFDEIQHEVEIFEGEAEEILTVGEMPSYREVIEEAQVFEQTQENEEQPQEYQQEFPREEFQPAEEAAREEEFFAEVESGEVFAEAVIGEQEQAFFDSRESTAPASFDESRPDEAQFEETRQIDETSEPEAANFEKPKAETVSCPFCSAENEPQVFVCRECRAMLTLSDLEMLLAHQEIDTELLHQKVEQMEIENNFSRFDAEGLKNLGIGLINLKNPRKGFEYLQEAAQLNPNDVLLNSQVNSLAIRLSEIEEQKNNHDAMPKNKTILVVDDSATVRKLISGKLEKCGHEVVCAVDGMEALEKINESIPDLILLDITMPRMDGYQVCKLIRGNEATKDVPVVMISGKDGFFDKVRGRMAGTTGYITKPFGPETLMKTVEAYIE